MKAYLFWICAIISACFCLGMIGSLFTSDFAGIYPNFIGALFFAVLAAKCA